MLNLGGSPDKPIEQIVEQPVETVQQTVEQPVKKTSQEPIKQVQKTSAKKETPIKKSTLTYTDPKLPKVEAPDEKEIQKALSSVNQELEQRESEAKQVSASDVPAVGGGGGNIAAADPAVANYRNKVRQSITGHWVKTHVGDTGDNVLRTRVLVRINAAGQVISKALIKQSGNSGFDHSALRAVEQASPFPQPPEGIRREALTEGFVIDFNSRMLGR